VGTGAHPDGGAQPVLDSLSALQQVAGHCPRSAESLLRDGHYNGRVSAAVTTVAPTISLLTWVKCPASMLRDGHYNGRVSAAVTTVHMQSFRRGHRLPRVVAARRPLQWSRLGGRYNGRAYNQSFGRARSAHFNKWRAIALARRSRCCATAITMVASRRPLQRSRLQSVF